MKIMALLGQYPPEELERRQAAMRKAASPGTQVDFAEIAGNVFRKGLTDLHRALVAPHVARLALEAEQAGYDAVVPYGTLDLGVEAARHVVSIPVIPTGRSGCHVAATLADRYGIICYDEPHRIMFGKLLRDWRVEPFVTSVRPVDVYVTSMATERESMKARFIETARRQIEDEGAQLILPLGLTMVPVTLNPRELADEIGVPVLDPLAIAMRLAETLAANGVRNSRIAYPAATLD